MPLTVTPVTTTTPRNGTCPAAKEISKCNLFYKVKWSHLSAQALENGLRAHLTNWNFITTPVRVCGRSIRVTLPFCTQWSILLRRGSFASFIIQESVHQRCLPHTWSCGFATSHLVTKPTSYNLTGNCPCTNTQEEWPFQVPPFVGDNYFCDRQSRSC